MFIILFFFISQGFAQDNFEDRFNQYLKSSDGQVKETNLDAVIDILFPNNTKTNVTMIASRSTQKDQVSAAQPRRLTSLNPTQNIQPGGASGDIRTQDIPSSFIGASPGKDELEVIVWNEKNKTYDFFVIENFGPGKTPKLVKPHKGECMQCHQNGGPIFTPFPWGESTFFNPNNSSFGSSSSSSSDRVQMLSKLDRTDAESDKMKFFWGENDFSLSTNGFGFDFEVRNSSKILQERSFSCDDLCKKDDTECKNKILKLSILSLAVPDSDSRIKLMAILKSTPDILKNITYPTSVLSERNIDKMGGNFVTVNEIVKVSDDINLATPADLLNIKFLHSLEDGSTSPSSFVPQGFEIKTRIKPVDDTNGPGHPAFPRDRVGLANISNTLGTCNNFTDKQKADLFGFPYDYMLAAINLVNPKATDDPEQLVAKLYEKIAQISEDPDKYLGQCQIEELNPLDKVVSDDLSLILASLEKNMKARPILDPLDPEENFSNNSIFEIFDDQGKRIGWRRNVMAVTDCSHGSCKPINFDIILDKNGKFLKYEEIKSDVFEFTKINHTPFTKSDHDKLNQLIEKSLLVNPEKISKKEDYIDAVSGATKLTEKENVVPLAAYTTNKVIDYIKSTITQVEGL
jgi:hypothetical protein